MRKLWDSKLNMNPQSHIQDMTNILQKLVELGEPDLTEKWKIAILLSSLPESYHTLVTALEARDSKTLTFALIQSKVIDEFLRRNKEHSSQDPVLKLQGEKKYEMKCFCTAKNPII